MVIEQLVTWGLGGLGGLAALGWCALHTMGTLALSRVPRLSLSKESQSEQLPSLSVVVAACNEVETIEAALRSLLGQDYPDFEVVIVDDRSTDGTGDLVERIARSNERVTAIHVTELPSGWLGKVNALRRGMEVASGHYVLFTDADVHFSPDSLRAAMLLAVAEELDHLTLLPHLQGSSLLHGALMQAFFVGYVRRTAGRPGLVTRKTPFGYGAFNLVRRKAFERTDGFEWFRMEVLDDLALGALMVKSGMRSGFAVAPDALRILWYPGLSAALRGFEKNMFGGLAGYRLGRLLGFAIGSVFLGVGPLLVFFQTGAPYLWLLPGVAFLCLFAEAVAARVRFGMPLTPSLMAPVTHILAAYAMIRGGLACTRRGGILWRGTLYPIDELRAGRRVSFP